MAIATDARADEGVAIAGPETLYEIVEGRMVEKPAMGAYEVELASFLQGLMDPFARSHRLGRAVAEMLFKIDRARGLSRRPDVAFISHDRWPIERRAPRSNAWEIVPDLAVEIISPTNTTIEDLSRLEEYFRAGSRAVWLVIPPVEKIYVYQSPTAVTILGRGDELDGAPLLPGFRLPLATYFGEPDA